MNHTDLAPRPARRRKHPPPPAGTLSAAPSNGREHPAGRRAAGRRIRPEEHPAGRPIPAAEPCRGLTRNGQSCKRPALADTGFCATHAHLAEPPEDQAGFGEGGRELRQLLVEVAGKLLTTMERFRGGQAALPSSRVMLEHLEGILRQILPRERSRILQRLSGILDSDFLSPDTWKGIVYVIEQTLRGLVDTRRRRRSGDYLVDEYGLDDEFFHTIRPLAQFFYHCWFRVRATGVENVPESGRALLVCNHSGVLPFDGAMVTEALWSQHPSPRYIRWLFLKWFVSFPFVAPAMNRLGAVLACPQNGERLLGEDQLVGVFPEGVKGIGKLYRDRYKLARFGRGGFIKICLRTRAPIVPVSVVGAEEIYPALTYADFLARRLGMPYLPITPTFPWLGLLGLVPLPTRWHIHFGSPFRFREGAPERAEDFLVVSLLTEKVRGAIQSQIDASLRSRRSVF